MSDQSAAPSPRALAAEKARLARYFQALAKHRRALELAIEENFEGALEEVAWRDAFESGDPHDVNRTMVVTGDHSAVLNSYVEMLRTSAGSRLIGLVPHRRPHAEQVFAAVSADGGLSEEQARLLNEAYVLEGRLEHASPDVEAEEVRDILIRLHTAMPELVAKAQVWLKRHGIELT